jgi:glyoxylase-like metal-dependent hydrolase (beta-lactamase superfamily II)
MASAYNVKSEIKTLEDKEKISLEGIELEVIHTPGHTPGGICLLLKKPVNNILFSGDTLFFQGVGRTDFPGANEGALIKSIKEKLLVLPQETTVYPGHGPSSTIGRERKSMSVY